GEDETLHQADVGTVGGVEREALREDLAQSVVGGGRAFDHGGVRFQKDVDSRDSIRVGFGSRRLGGLGGGAAGAESQHRKGARHRSVEQDVFDVCFHGSFLSVVCWFVGGLVG